MKFHDIKITTNENGTVKHLFIDDVEQKGVVACDIRLRPDEIPSMKLEYRFLNLDAALSATVVDANKTFTDGFLNLGIEHFELSVRAYNTIADVVIAYRTGHLKKYNGMGHKTYDEIIGQLKKFGLIAEDDE